MPIFTLRVNDGSFFLCEADDENHARSMIKLGETMPLDPADERIVSVTQMERNTFMSRWFYECHKSLDDAEIGQASGTLDAMFEAPIMKKDFPAIDEAHRIACEMPIGDPKSSHLPIIHPKNMRAWTRTIKRQRVMLTEAIHAERARFQDDKKAA